jgi:hypothetical protein
MTGKCGFQLVKVTGKCRRGTVPQVSEPEARQEGLPRFIR